MSSHTKHSDRFPLQNFCEGRKVPAESKQTISVTTPHTGEEIAVVPLSQAKDVEKAVHAANEAFKTWSKLTVNTRCNFLTKFHNAVMEKYLDELTSLIVLEHGKTKGEAKAEILKGLETLNYASGLPALCQGKYLEVSRGVTCRDERVPLGVVVSIVPFNFPFMVPFWTIGHAIGTGNTIIVKPSEKVPLTIARVAEIWKEVGLPDGVFNVIHGTADAVNALVDHPLVKCVTFVGTTRIAELLSKRARNMNKRCLALGGAKNHLVAAPDCNPDMTAQDVVNSFTGCTGQRCMAASVLLTIGERQDLLDLIVKKASALSAGAEKDQMGPVIDLTSKERILKYIDEAERKYGAKVLLDGRSWAKKDKGFWVGPTVLLCKSPSDPAMKEEIFGPVISIYQCKTAEEAINIENSSPYGNAACIYTESGKTAEWFLERFGAAMLGCNIGVPVPREPFSFGGTKASKFGDFDITGDGAIDLFTVRRKITTKWVKPEKQTWLS